MAKQNHADSVVKKVTDQIIAAIEAGSVGKWEMPWRKIATDMPMSLSTKRPYRGINVPILYFAAVDAGYTSPWWGTFNHWKGKDAKIRKGEHATKIVLWKPTLRKERDAATGEETKRPSLYLTTYNVFNACQVEGWEEPAKPERNTPERIAEAEAYFDTIGADVRYGGNHASYNPLSDYISMPHLDQFDEAAPFYSTLGHEHVHWTGHKSRLDRQFGKRFGDDAYGAEELVAELGAALLSAKLGIDTANRQDHAAYLASWLRVLKRDARSLMTVMSKAQAAVDHLDKCAGLTKTASEADETTDEMPADRLVA